jgi:CheY-like chemotaxis protein
VKILLVDNEIYTLKIMRQMLEQSGFEIITAVNGRECIEKAKADRPDIILMDVMMPEMSGWDALKIIRADNAIKDVPVAMLSAKRELNRELLQLADMYFTKPLEKDELLKSIQSVIKEK